MTYEKLQTEYGVSRGTLLRAMLFNLYLNDIIKHTPNCKIYMFADYIMVSISRQRLYYMFKCVNVDHIEGSIPGDLLAIA